MQTMPLACTKVIRSLKPKKKAMVVKKELKLKREERIPEFMPPSFAKWKAFSINWFKAM